MKAKVLTSVLVVVMFLTSVIAYGQEKTVYENVENTGSYMKKEYITVDKYSKSPISKKLYVYDVNGLRTERIEYVWSNNSSGWEAVTRYEYEYADNRLLLSTIHSKWDKSNNGWSDNVEQMIYNYDENGLLANVDKVYKKKDQLASISR